MTNWLNGPTNIEDVERSVMEISQATDEARRLIQSLTPQLTRLRSLQEATPEPAPRPSPPPEPVRAGRAYDHLPADSARADRLQLAQKLRELQQRLKAWETEILAELAGPAPASGASSRATTTMVPRSVAIAPPHPTGEPAVQHRSALTRHPAAPAPEAKRTVCVTIASLDGFIDARRITGALVGLAGVSGLAIVTADRTELSITFETDRAPGGLLIREALLSISPEGVTGGWDGDDQFIAVLGRTSPLRGPAH